MGYLSPDSEGAFLDLVKQSPTDFWVREALLVECPKCRGYGMWHLELRDDGNHFDAYCGQCDGWGFVLEGSKDASCVHVYEEIGQDVARYLGVPHYGSCYHVVKCVNCGAIRSYDSSD